MFNKLLSTLGLAAVCTLAFAREVPFHRDVNATKVNASTWRTELIFYPTEQEALAKTFEQSPFYVSLNGIWDFKYADSEKTLDAAEWTTIKVPGNWEFQGFGIPVYVNHPYEFNTEDPQPPHIPDEIPVGLYKRTFSLPDAWKGRAVYLNVCGAKSGVYVYLNGSEIGYNEDSKNLARYDISDVLKEGENELMLKCYRWSSGSYLECQDFWRVSGIERDVYLSTEQIKDDVDFKIVSTLDENLSNGLFSLKVSSSLTPYYKLLDKDGSVLAEGLADVDKLKIPNVRHWSAESPELYTLLVKIGEEYTRFNVGFRRLEIKGNVFYFNGQPVKFKGVNIHEHHEFTGHYITRDYMLDNLKRMRELGINAIRTAHYPQPRFFYELCDSLGFYVYSEANIESHGMGYGERSLAKDPAWYAKHHDRVMNMYMRTANYPCVNILSLGNEAGDGINFDKTYDILKDFERDGQNRPVVYERAKGGRNTDFLNPMYPDAAWLRHQGLLPSEKPVVLCEYSHAMGNSNGSFDYMWDEFYKFTNLQGGFVWDWMDQGIAAVDAKGKKFWKYGGDYGDPEKDPKGWWKDRNFCCNGMVNPDLSVHPGSWEIKHFYQEVSVTKAEEGFRVFNRHYFIPLNHELQWEITEDGKVIKNGSSHLATAPQSSEIFAVDFPEMEPTKSYYINFKTLTLSANELLPEGYPIATDQILLQKGVKPEAAPVAYKVKVTHKGERIVLRGCRGKVVVNISTGFVEQYRLGCRNVIDKKFGLRPNFWRSPNDNEWGNKGPVRRYAAWKDSLSVLKVDTSRDEYGAAVIVSYGLPEGCSMDVSYKLLAGGTLRIDASFNKGDKHVDIPRIGFRTRMKARYDRFSYFGRGPHENYSDRFTSSWVGIYESRASEELYPYVRPQESGHHTGVEWFKIGPVRISAPQDFEFNALRCSIEDLDPREADGSRIWGHVNEVPLRPYVELCLDGFMTGVGGYNSWGSKPEPDRSVWTDLDYSFSLIFSRK